MPTALSRTRLAVWLRATAFAVALTTLPGIATAEVTELFLELRHPSLETRQTALDRLLHDSNATVRRRVAQELVAALDSASSTYLERLLSLLRQQAVRQRRTRHTEIARLRQRLWTLLDQHRTAAMRPVYHKLHSYWFPWPETFPTDPDLVRARADIIWYTARSRELGAPVSSSRQRLSDLQQQARFESMLQTSPDSEKAAVYSALALRQRLREGEFQVLTLTNAYRLMMGLPALHVSLSLIECARHHSEDMRVYNFFGHLSPVSERKTLAQRARSCGQRVRSENIARQCATGTAAFWRWFGSSPHHRNMLDAQHQEIGVGQSQLYYTEWFK